MSGARRGTNKTFTLIKSDVAPVASVIDLTGIDSSKPHCFVGAQFFADADGLVSATPGAGTIAIDVQTINMAPVFEPVANNIMDMTRLMTLSWAANTQRLRATPTGITVATHYRIVVTCNEY